MGIPLIDFMSAEIAEIYAAREKAKILHKSKNIRASGNEVEEAVRRLLKNKLPQLYNVSQGHIVDSDQNVSGQLDIIITDKSAPVFAQSDDNTQYVLYESVYAIGEIKTAYNKGDIDVFQESVERIKAFHREKTPVNYISGVTFDQNFEVKGTTSYKNPLFSFMVFLESNSFNLNHVSQLYKTKDYGLLVNVICLIDRGLICFCQLDGNKCKNYIANPEFISDRTNPSNKWMFQSFGQDEQRKESNLAMLVAMLQFHLRTCELMPPDILKYYNNFLVANEGVTID